MGERPSWDVHFLRVADLASEMSTCSRLAVGAVLVRDKRVLAMSHNGAPSKRPHCDHSRCMTHDTKWGHATEGILGGCVQSGTVNNHCESALHAEENIIIFCAQNGIPTKGAMLYLNATPCARCIRRIDQAGIRRVVYSREYHNTGPGVYDYCRVAGISLEMIS